MLRITDLPSEVIALIGSYTDITTILELRTVSRALRAGVSNVSTYRELIAREFAERKPGTPHGWVWDDTHLVARAGTNMDIWSRFLVAFGLAERRGGQLSDPGSWCIALALVGHHIIHEPRWRCRSSEVTAYSVSCNFMRVVHCLSRQTDQAPEDVDLSVYTLDAQAENAGIESEINRACLLLLIAIRRVRIFNSSRRSIWPYELLDAKLPRIQKLPCSGSQATDIPLPFATKADSTHWLAWYRRYCTRLAHSLCESGRWQGYYSDEVQHNSLQTPQHPLFNNKFESVESDTVSERITFRSLSVFDGYGSVDLIATTKTSTAGTIAMDVVTRHRNGVSKTWDCFSTPFGIVGHCRAGKIINYIWLWREEWSSSS